MEERRLVRGTGQQRTDRTPRSGRWRLFLASLLAVSLPLVSTTAVPVTTASFTGASANPANTFAAATLNPPTGLTATQTCAGASINAGLAWTPTSSTWADGYTWDRTAGATTSASTAVAGRATAATTDSTALAAATTYQYRLRATASTWRSTAATATLTTTSCTSGVQVADVTSATIPAAGSSISIAKPANTVPGDLLVVFVSDAGTVAVTPDQAGWTQIRSDQSHNAWITQTLWYRWAGASEPASYSFTKGNPKADMIAAALRITGANATTPIDTSAGSSQGGTVSTTIVAPSVTTTVPNTLLLTFASTTDGNTYTPAPGMTERIDTTIGTWISEQVATQTIAAAGPTGTRTITLSAMGNVYAAASTLAIRP
jgi:hypothetical protein